MDKHKGFKTASEADTGTKEIAGEGRQRVFRQLLGYVATHEQKLHTNFFGWENFRVLFLTTSRERVAHLIEANKAFNQGLGSRMFLFTDTASLHASPDVYELEWLNGQGQAVKLLD